MGRTRKVRYITYRKYGVLRESYTGNYTVELRLVRWDKDEPIYDLRAWRNIKGKEMPCSYGFKFSRAELCALRDTLNAMAELNAPIVRNSPPWADVLALCNEKCSRKDRACKQ